MLHLLRRVAQAGVLALAASLRVLLPGKALALLKENLTLVKRMDYAPKPIVLNIESRIEHDVRLHSCAKEAETVQWIEDYVKAGDVLYDIGANIGAYSLVAAKANSGGVMVYAFEPAFRNYAQLCQNIYLNGCGESIVPFPVALSDKTSLESLNYQNLIPGGALHALGEARDYKGDSFKPVFQQMTLSFSLDDLVGTFGIKPPNHIKMDVDGIEASILRGAVETFKNPSLRTILVEVEEDRPEATEIVEFLEGHDFKLKSKHGSSFGASTTQFSNSLNYVFLREE